ncbi:hypothetical protein CY34DRAFT_813199 [Suillus luteus UH-Slu-Lm8-n1]|uniref:DUF6534 domain-containing protein n=1 Tax=Suillus luteus UH-Slu-Lm8-n1 TaxID=930992 RepID=A0A0C9ZXD0_9AGAM|nr:hypothetical protein CY34DRAFT_813199 [Suillus luteus UH-Slu-Lm8-n1]
MGGMSALSAQFIGLTISFVQLGIAAAQGLYYYRVFPHDKRLLKYLVVTVSILNTAGTVLSSFMYWSFVSNCFRSTSPRCQAWDTAAMILLFVSITLPFTVQSFYCHRVWIISGRKLYATIPIILFATSSYVLGLILIPPQQAGAFANDAILKISAAAAIQSISCDFTISFSVYFYLRPERTGVRRMDTRIQSITHNFISMGFLVCLLAISICILYWAGAPAAIGGVAMVLRSSYTNSFLALLNARQRPDRLPTMEIELPTSLVHNSR